MPDLINIFPRNQQLALARTDLQFNFETINDIWAINHIDLESLTNNGKHSQIDFIGQSAVPSGIPNFITMANVPDQFGNLFMYFVKQASSNKMELNQYITPQLSFLAVRLPSGIILKMAQVGGNFSGGNNGRITIPWNQLSNNGVNDIPFSNQLWAQVIFGTGVSGTTNPVPIDNVGWPYVEDISIPTQVSIRIWKRDSFNTRINNLVCVWSIFAIGV